jgi:hypothetical protein
LFEASWQEQQERSRTARLDLEGMRDPARHPHERARARHEVLVAAAEADRPLQDVEALVLAVVQMERRAESLVEDGVDEPELLRRCSRPP